LTSYQLFYINRKVTEKGRGLMMKKGIKLLAIGICIFALVLPVYISSAASLLMNHTYMPIVNNQPTLTPTPQLPVLFPNGDFEQGRVIWTQYSSHDYPMIYNYQDFPSAAPPYDGVWEAWLGGLYEETSYIEQQVYVSPSLPYLSYWYRVDPSVGCVSGLGMVNVNGVMLSYYSLCTATGGWVHSVVNLGLFAGQTVPIQFRAETDATTNSDLFIDHVGFQASQSSGNSPAEDMNSIDISTLKQYATGK
jgi:hypothetical protein